MAASHRIPIEHICHRNLGRTIHEFGWHVFLCCHSLHFVQICSNDNLFVFEISFKNNWVTRKWINPYVNQIKLFIYQNFKLTNSCRPAAPLVLAWASARQRQFLFLIYIFFRLRSGNWIRMRSSLSTSSQWFCLISSRRCVDTKLEWTYQSYRKRLFFENSR